jgi:hypothetical protein
MLAADLFIDKLSAAPRADMAAPEVVIGAGKNEVCTEINPK